jgi:glycosyltransferase involved in cell wall biosynthesis
MALPKVVVLRGHNANVWDLRPLEGLADAYDVRALVTGSNLHETSSLRLPVEHVATPRDKLPGGRAAGAAAYALGERYLGLEDHLRGADIVHAAEIGTWFSAQAAGLKRKLGFRLVVTAWETLPHRATYRWPRERRYRDAVLEAADLYLATTERAKRCLLLEGVPEDRILVVPPGVAIERFAAARPPATPPGRHTILSAGRLVWEKGHQDVLRAVALLRRERDDLRLVVIGDGPERGRLERYAADLGLEGVAEFPSRIPYDDMPTLYAAASALVLASLPTKVWEEQFGMVLVEALAAGTPVVACSSGAIPEVLDGAGTLVDPGDWAGLASALEAGPLAQAPGTRAPSAQALLERYSTAAHAARVRAAYDRVLISGAA